MSPSGDESVARDRTDMDFDLNLFDSPIEVDPQADPPSTSQGNDADQVSSSEHIDLEDEGAGTELPASSDPLQPLSGAPAMNAALEEIGTGAPAAQTQGGDMSLRPLERLRRLHQEYERRRAAEAALAEAAAKAQNVAKSGEKRGRSDSGPATNSAPAIDSGPATDSKKAKSNEVQVDWAPEDFTEARNPRKRMSCAVMIDDNPIMGNPFGSCPGYGVEVSIDAGCDNGAPSIGLNFKISKDGNDTKAAHGYNTFTVGWQPGVKVHDNWMMDNLKWTVACKQEDPDLLAITYSKAIQDLLKDKKEEEKLICLTFNTGGYSHSHYDQVWPMALKGIDWHAIDQNCQTLFNDVSGQTHQVTIWFTHEMSSVAFFDEHCIDYIERAVQYHIPPYSQYYGRDGEPTINFTLDSVHVIGNGMCRKYPREKDARGKTFLNTAGKCSYYKMPKKVTWDAVKSFHIFHGVPIIREMQYQKAIHARIENDWHRVFLERMSALTMDGKALTLKTVFKHSFYAGVRLTRNPKTGLKDNSPPEGSTIKVEFNNGKPALGIEHDPRKLEAWTGRVVARPRSWHEKTKTDFCILLTKPRESRQFMTYKRPDFRADEALPEVKLSVRVNLTPARRDLIAFNKLCDPTWHPELLDEVRLALWSDPSRFDHSEPRDLTMGPRTTSSLANKQKYNRLLNFFEGQRRVNASQDRVLKAASRMRNNLVCVSGPPGAGKTRTLRDKVITLTSVGHKVAVTAPSNVAVDTDANAIWDGLQLLPEADRKNIKCLRLETDGAESAARLTKKNYADYEAMPEGKLGEPAEYLEPEKAEDTPAIRNALEKISAEFAIRQTEVATFLKDYEDVEKAHAELLASEKQKKSHVPLGMTLDYRIWEITTQDRRDAERQYDEMQAKMGEEQFAIKFASDEISVDMFDKSLLYRQMVANYIKADGKLSKQARGEFGDAHDRLVSRVLAATDILFTTCSNAGGDLLENDKSFQPTTIFCDEAGQATIPGLCVPLTTWTQWEGVFLFGDSQQFEPTILSGQFNEFILNAKLSPLALLLAKGYESYLLDTQYRMAPACSLFPKRQFYDDKGLKDSPAAKQDNGVREAIRKMTLSKGIKGEQGKGTEYFFCNVRHGVSRVELNGTSLINHANADTALAIIKDMLALDKTKGEKIDASMIKILSYYQGQARLLREKIHATNWAPEVKKAIEVSTVDSYQGREARIVIVDTVVARDRLNTPTRLDQDAPDDAEDFGGEDYVKAGQVTGHVKNPHRLNVALTRGRDCTIVLGQEALLLATSRSNRGKLYNSLSNMVVNARTRNCLRTTDQEDMHPGSVTTRNSMSAQSLKQKRDKQWKSDFDFINVQRQRYNRSKHLTSTNSEAKPPVYRTPRGDTTRPIGNPELVAAADAHDKLAADAKLALERSKNMSEEKRGIQKAKENLLLDTQDPAQFPPLGKGKEGAGQEVAPPDNAKDEVMRDPEAEEAEEIPGDMLISDDEEGDGEEEDEGGNIAAGAREPKDTVYGEDSGKSGSKG